jgi:hypothetical protein
MENSQDRSFFNYRNVIPGYSFLLILLSMNIGGILTLVDQYTGDPAEIVAVIGIVIGFVTLFSGSALGYLLCQIWFLISHWAFDAYAFKWKTNKRRDLLKIIDKDIYTRPKSESHKEQVFLDYVIHEYGEKTPNVGSFFSRRWDVYNTNGASIFSIVFSFVIGFFLHSSILPPSFEVGKLAQWICIIRIVGIVSSILISFLFLSLFRIRNETYAMFEIIIRNHRDAIQAGWQLYIIDYTKGDEIVSAIKRVQNAKIKDQKSNEEAS